MGLAAQQARLLTITSRKADCEYQSMSLSHQKLAISRELEDLSSEYQNSLNQTKLVYDYYGTGETNEQLKYSTLMTPSGVNDYTPVTVTNQAGRVVLDSKYAAAAKAAGIPQEGLGCVPSTLVRDQFYYGLAAQGVITEDKAKLYTSTAYNQGLGIGASTTEMTYTTTPVTLDELKDVLTGTSIKLTKPSGVSCRLVKGTGIEDSAELNSGTITLSQLLSDDPADQVTYLITSEKDYNYPTNECVKLANQITSAGDVIDQIYNGFASVLLTGDPRSEQALNYAKQKTLEMFDTSDVDSVGKDNEKGNIDDIATYNGYRPKKKKADDMRKNIMGSSDDAIGIVYNSFYKGGLIGRKFSSAAALNLNNVAKAFLSYYASYMEGLPADVNDDSAYKVEKGWKSSCSLVTDDPNYVYYVAGESTITSETDNQYINFYDTLLNQICTAGWTENEQVNDPEYLQQMFQNGMMFVTRLRDDGYYYQGNYATDSYIKEVSDETAIAQAEAKYNTQKAKLNSKEQTLDLKMKNLDTEISSLTTEYDTIKNTISKNIEKSFKRYNA